jgi:hypothetical protein
VHASPGANLQIPSDVATWCTGQAQELVVDPVQTEPIGDSHRQAVAPELSVVEPRPQAVHVGPCPVAENVLRGQTHVPEPLSIVGGEHGAMQRLVERSQVLETQSVLTAQVSPSIPLQRPFASSWLTGHSQAFRGCFVCCFAHVCGNDK